MCRKAQYIVGTSGYSFSDWVGPFYPPGTKQREMLDYYASRFEAVELNFTFYRMPDPATLERMAEGTGSTFRFWVKANRLITHELDRSVTGAFVDQLAPLIERRRLLGVLLQFPQSFHRTVNNRRYLASALADLESVPTAVEFRHRSWDDPATLAGLRERNVTLVVPDVPEMPDLFRVAPRVTSGRAYFRMHSRRRGKWYAGGAERYDYDYSEAELQDLAAACRELESQVDEMHVFFNNCHRGQAARNAEAFRRILAQLDSAG